MGLAGAGRGSIRWSAASANFTRKANNASRAVDGASSGEARREGPQLSDVMIAEAEGSETEDSSRFHMAAY